MDVLLIQTCSTNTCNIFIWIDKHIESIKLRYLPNHAHAIIYKFVHVRATGFFIISSYSILSLSSSLAPTFQTGCHRRPPWQYLCGETRPCLCRGSTAPSTLWSHPACGKIFRKTFRSKGAKSIACQVIRIVENLPSFQVFRFPVCLQHLL